MQVGSLLPKQCHVQHQKLLAETHIYPTLNMGNVLRVKTDRRSFSKKKKKIDRRQRKINKAQHAYY